MVRPVGATLALLLSSTLALGACGGSGEGDGELPDSFRVVVDTEGWPCGDSQVTLDVTGAPDTPTIDGYTCTGAVDTGSSWDIACDSEAGSLVVGSIVISIDKDIDGGEVTVDYETANDCDATFPILSITAL